jgi:NADH-quinone oxidoreductase subunit L
MFLGCGVGAFSAGVFHVITHAFFKALLFLGAGSVIHGMHEEQNIMKMGGLKSKMPVTYFIFLIGLLAISGIPPFSGFFSKDEILWMAFSSEHGSKMLWLIGMITAAMTAFYMTRLFTLTFLGKQRSDVHAHESPLIMTIPLLILALLSAVGGAIGIPHQNWLAHWLEPVVGAHGEPTVSASLEFVLMALSAGVAIVMMTVAFRFYRNLDRAQATADKYPGLYKALYNKWFVDEAYGVAFIKPFHSLSRFFWKVIDVSVIDRIVLAFGGTAQLAGESVRMTQTGRLQVYGAFVLFGLLITVGFLIYGLA